MSVEKGEPLRSSYSFETNNFAVTHYHVNSQRLVFVFASAGRLAPGEPIEEFKKSLRKLDLSMVFVTDKQTEWFNHAETKSVFDRLSGIADRYTDLGALGESMGGSGALLCSEHMPRVSRVLSISPQYSIMPPFIDFDYRFNVISRTIEHHYYTSFSGTRLRDECVLLFGNIDWRDCMHSSAFMAEGFQIVFVDRAPHSVAAYLKGARGENQLIRLLERFADFSTPFTATSVKASLASLVGLESIKREFSFAKDFERNRSVLRNLNSKYELETGQPIGNNRCIGKNATQSSICKWSRHQSPEVDARGAISGAIDGFYSFHTNFEKNPWWMVDLEKSINIKEVRIFNLLDPILSSRASKFFLEISTGDEVWLSVHERTDEQPFGGADGRPFIWRPDQETIARYVRIRLATENWFHLDQVEVYGPDASLADEPENVV